MKIPEIIEKNKNAVILIDVVIPQENNQSKISIKGTGFIISPDGKFITNAHVYKQVQQNEMEFLGVSAPGKTDEKGATYYDRFKIKLLKMDEENDLALLQIVSDKKDFKTIDGIDYSENIREGEEIIFIGYPLAVELLTMGFGITMTTNKSIVSSVKKRAIDGSFHFFLIDGHINNGSSGSPVFSVETGKIIGVASAKISAKIQIPGGQIADIPANMGICRPAKYIENLLK